MTKKLYEDQVRDYKEIMSRVNKSIPLVCLCGNHDVGNTPTLESIGNYTSNFGDDYFSFWVNGVKCIVLNLSLFSDSSGAEKYHEEQEKWLLNELQKSMNEKPTHLLIFQHQPWFLVDPGENDDYFNIPIQKRLKILKQLKDAGVRAVFAGHYHRNSISFDEKL